MATSVGFAVLSVVGLAACDSGPEGSPSQVAETVADALEAGDLGGLPVVDGTPETSQQQLEQAWDGLGEAPRSVEVIEVEPADDAMSSRAQMRLTFDLPGDGADLVRDVPVRMRVSENVWSLAWEHALLGVPLGQRLQVEQVREPRADIVDRDGDPLATRRPVWRVGIDKTRLAGEQAAAASRDLAEAAGLDEDAYADRVTSAGPEAFVELITYRQDDPDGQELAAATDGIPGATAIEDEQVLGPTRTFAQPLLGTVGPVTAEMLEQNPERYESGDVVGLTGLQAAFDDQLRGEPSTRVVAVDEDTGASILVMEQEAKAGQELRLTLSGPLQREAHAALAEVGPPCALVALDHSTGDLLAVANGPGSQGASTALAGQYAPGSTFKVATALGLLRQGFTPDSQAPAPRI
ncbi:penicillin-binding transpeptidase domain-containing protein [Serinicoccus sediminis]|uniref:penicillin-binding transpeptidase domain-containing protein n=1 Tax=Serinicoccus sediminis TaxID=2306021 RepID=UPI0013EBE1B8|nr:penicillin-binding transpeptidase domain-containing protein [Serinicoccus sediminis]